MRPPSRGGIGNRLNIARMTLSRRAFFRFVSQPVRHRSRNEANKMKGERCDRRQKQIHAGAGRCDQYRAHAGIMKCAKINRHWLRIAKEKWRTQQQQHNRKHDRSKRIDMDQRIETDPTQAPSSVIAQKVRDKAMGCFMEGNCYERRKRPNRDFVEDEIERPTHSDARISANLACGLNSVPPEILEPIRRHFGVPNRVLDISMAHEVLEGSRVMPIIGELIASGVPQHVWVDRE